MKRRNKRPLSDASIVSLGNHPVATGCAYPSHSEEQREILFAAKQSGLLYIFRRTIEEGGVFLVPEEGDNLFLRFLKNMVPKDFQGEARLNYFREHYGERTRFWMAAIRGAQGIIAVVSPDDNALRTFTRLRDTPVPDKVSEDDMRSVSVIRTSNGYVQSSHASLTSIREVGRRPFRGFSPV